MLTEAVIIDDLPVALVREIGRIVVKFARLEHKLSQAIYTVLQVHRVEGRLAVREPRVPERLDLVQELLEIREVEVEADFTALRKMLVEAANKRDQLAHGIWVRDPHTRNVCLRVTKGQWPADQRADGRKKRVVVPEGIPITVEMLVEVLDTIKKALAGVDALGAEIDLALSTSPEKFQSLLQSKNPLLGNRPIKP